MGEYIERLKNCQNTAQLGSILRGVSVKQFMSIQDSLINKPDSLYSEFTIPKKGGEERTIQAPCKEIEAGAARSGSLARRVSLRNQPGQTG